MNLADERRNYSGTLRRADLTESPLELFEKWYAEARDRVHEGNAMTLATVGDKGQPLQRTVLLKAVDERGFVFYSNYLSRKAEMIEENNQVCLLFPWIDLERQVIIRGRAEKVSREESQAYFETRPHESQLGAWVSEQSSEIESRSVLEKGLDDLTAQFDGKDIPLPDFWGGYLVRPETIEFWQGGPGRVHDRFEYRRDGDTWSAVRLSP